MQITFEEVGLTLAARPSGALTGRIVKARQQVVAGDRLAVDLHVTPNTVS